MSVNFVNIFPFLGFISEIKVLCRSQGENESTEYFNTFPHALEEHYNFTGKFHYEDIQYKISCARKDRYISLRKVFNFMLKKRKKLVTACI